MSKIESKAANSAQSESINVSRLTVPPLTCDESLVSLCLYSTGHFNPKCLPKVASTIQDEFGDKVIALGHASGKNPYKFFSAEIARSDRDYCHCIVGVTDTGAMLVVGQDEDDNRAFLAQRAPFEFRRTSSTLSYAVIDLQEVISILSSHLPKSAREEIRSGSIFPFFLSMHGDVDGYMHAPQDPSVFLGQVVLPALQCIQTLNPRAAGSHIVLVLDTCFGRTIAEALSSSLNIIGLTPADVFAPRFRGTTNSTDVGVRAPANKKESFFLSLTEDVSLLPNRKSQRR